VTFPSTQAVSLLAQDDKQALDEKWQRAVDMKLFPDTNLAREIFTNLQAYPDDILLTRVGMFYEVSHESRYRLSSTILRARRISDSHTSLKPQR
jgi:hypothetical protein